jgi:hypothetical protein
MTNRILTRERLLEIIKCYEHLPEAENVEVTILKGHLLIEGKLIEYIRKKIDNPDAFDSERFRFSQLLVVARSLSTKGKFDDLWMSIQKLNTLRNQLAHELEQPELNKALEGFIGFHATHFFQGEASEYHNIHSCVVSLYSSMVHLIAEDA